MESKQEKLILAKLLKIAENQQKTIEALVKRAQQVNPMIDYLTKAANTAVFNSGLSGVSVNVSADTQYNKLNSGGGSIQKSNDAYTINIHGAPNDNKAKQSFIDEVNRMIDSQKPELSGKVDILFVDK